MQIQLLRINLPMSHSRRTLPFDNAQGAARRECDIDELTTTLLTQDKKKLWLSVLGGTKTFQVLETWKVWHSTCPGLSR
jgi:hypothetical protein